jgi:hypothetical protein
MVSELQYRVPIGLSSARAIYFLNEAFRKLNQMSKGGFVWQLKQTTLAFGFSVSKDAPDGFDAGKSAWLLGDPTFMPTRTLIPYKPWSEFSNMQHYQTTAPGTFTAWTYVPNFTLTAPTSYKWTITLAPVDAAVAVPPGITLPFIYHAMTTTTFASGNTTFFPTPDQFDSLILDLAESEAKRIYNVSNWDRIAQQANQAILEIIDTYRSDRYDLSGLFDVTAEAKEKQTERER